jgi:hypothetical protein
MKKYIIYDGRATSDTDDASVMECCDTLKEAITNAPDYGNGCCIWSYDVKGKNLINEKLEKIMPL